MASFDWKTASTRRAADAHRTAEDPLVELARIVSAGDGYFQPLNAQRTEDPAFAPSLEADLFAAFETARPDASADGDVDAFDPAFLEISGPEPVFADEPLRGTLSGEAPPANRNGEGLEFDGLFAAAIAEGRDASDHGFVVPQMLTGDARGPAANVPKRGWMNRGALAAAVSTVAVLGGAVAWFSSDEIAIPSGPVPVIEADAQPFKVHAEAPKAIARAETGQAVFDKVAGRTPTKVAALVDRTEEPQAIAAELRSEEADFDLPADAGDEGLPITASISADTAPEVSAAPVEPIMPHRVKTVRIGGESRTATPEPAPQAAPAVEAETPAATADVAPTAKPRTRPTVVAAAATAIPEPVPEAAPRSRALAETAPAVEEPAPVATPEPVADGYAIQVSSQKTEEAAKGALAKLKKTHSGILAGSPASIARADLGAKGVYYRVRLGPFASKGEANGVCGQLKAAGGTCFVTR